MKKLVKICLLILSLFIVLTTLCSCGKESAADAKKSSGYSENYYGAEDAAPQTEKSSSQSTGTSEQLTSNRKIIEYIDLSVETKTFDKLIDDISAAVKQSGGYIESSEVGGNSYYGTGRRSAELKIRVPQTKQADFSRFLSENSNVVRRTVTTEDITDKYIDTQSRLKALKLEKETLEKLLTQAADVSETLTVYEKLTDVIAQIESYQGKLDQMDNLIEYTTFTVYIDEVEKETNVEKQSWFAKTRKALADNFSDMWYGLLDFLSFVIAALPYWLLLGAAVVVIILIVRRIKKKKAKKNKQ